MVASRYLLGNCASHPGRGCLENFARLFMYLGGCFVTFITMSLPGIDGVLVDEVLAEAVAMLMV